MLKDWLKLYYLKSISLARKRALVNFFGSPVDIFKASHLCLIDSNILPDAGINAVLMANKNETEQVLHNDLELLESIDSQFIGFNDPQFSDLLNEIPSPPLGLFVKGNINLLKQPQIAIVGSRSPSPSGKKTTYLFAAELTALGFTITSGMAAGIDSCAHSGSLSVNNATIAVMGTGIDRIYPASHQTLYQEISEKGLIVTEFAPGTPPHRANFPQRNRIISGLSVGTLVAEAGIRSGSLITARLAAEQGREVFAIPGSIHLQTSHGCHHLIRLGAKLVESVQDITDEISHFFNQTPPVPQISREAPHSHFEHATEHETEHATEHPLYNLIDYAPISIDQIIALSGLTTEQVSSILIDLELRGLIAEMNGGYQRLPDMLS